MTRTIYARMGWGVEGKIQTHTFKLRIINCDFLKCFKLPYTKLNEASPVPRNRITQPNGLKGGE